MQVKYDQTGKVRPCGAKFIFSGAICPKCPIGKKVRENKVVEEFPPFIEIVTMDKTKVEPPVILPRKKVVKKSVTKKKVTGRPKVYRKLTAELVIALREETGSTRSLAKKYGINESTLRDVLLRRTWKNV
jgi:hypothetical protein